MLALGFVNFYRSVVFETTFGNSFGSLQSVLNSFWFRSTNVDIINTQLFTCHLVYWITARCDMCDSCSVN